MLSPANRCHLFTACLNAQEAAFTAGVGVLLPLRVVDGDVPDKAAALSLARAARKQALPVRVLIEDALVVGNVTDGTDPPIAQER